MMRTFGILLISIVPIIIGAMSAGRVTLGGKQLEAFCNMIDEIRRKIDYLKLPLDEIFVDIEYPCLTEFCGDLRELGFTSALDRARGSLMISDEAYNALASFASELGKSSAEEQIRNCEATHERLSAELAKCRQNAPDKTKISTALGVMSGSLVFLLLV